MPDFVLSTGGKPWIESFRDEEKARRAVAKRGHILTKIVPATAAAREQCEKDRAEIERCENEQAEKERADRRAAAEEAGTKAADAAPPPAEIVLTTAFTVAGREIEREIEVITAECAFGMNLFRDFFVGVRDVFGGRSKATQKILREARVNCLTELRREASSVGADAVIGVDLAYSEFSGKNKSMLFLVGSGTAVKLKPADEQGRAST